MSHQQNTPAGMDELQQLLHLSCATHKPDTRQKPLPPIKAPIPRIGAEGLLDAIVGVCISKPKQNASATLAVTGQSVTICIAQNIVAAAVGVRYLLLLWEWIVHVNNHWNTEDLTHAERQIVFHSTFGANPSQVWLPGTKVRVFSDTIHRHLKGISVMIYDHCMPKVLRRLLKNWVLFDGVVWLSNEKNPFPIEKMGGRGPEVEFISMYNLLKLAMAEANSGADPEKIHFLLLEASKYYDSFRKLKAEPEIDAWLAFMNGATGVCRFFVTRYLEKVFSLARNVLTLQECALSTEYRKILVPKNLKIVMIPMRTQVLTMDPKNTSALDCIMYLHLQSLVTSDNAWNKSMQEVVRGVHKHLKEFGHRTSTVALHCGINMVAFHSNQRIKRTNDASPSRVLFPAQPYFESPYVYARPYGYISTGKKKLCATCALFFAAFKHTNSGRNKDTEPIYTSTPGMGSHPWFYPYLGDNGVDETVIEQMSNSLRQLFKETLTQDYLAQRERERLAERHLYREVRHDEDVFMMSG